MAAIECNEQRMFRVAVPPYAVIFTTGREAPGLRTRLRRGRSTGQVTSVRFALYPGCFPQRSAATSRLYRPCRSPKSLHSREASIFAEATTDKKAWHGVTAHSRVNFCYAPSSGGRRAPCQKCKMFAKEASSSNL